MLTVFYFVYHICLISFKSSPLLFIFIENVRFERLPMLPTHVCFHYTTLSLLFFYVDKGIWTLKILRLKQACIPFHHIHLAGAVGLEPTMNFFAGFGDQCLTIRLYPYDTCGGIRTLKLMRRSLNPVCLPNFTTHAYYVIKTMGEGFEPS